jgi:hypothetical protein
MLAHETLTVALTDLIDRSGDIVGMLAFATSADGLLLDRN